MSIRASLPSSAPLICVLIQGGGLDISLLQAPCDAIVAIGYPGMQGGPALWDVLLGLVPPAGRTVMAWLTSRQVIPARTAHDDFMYTSDAVARVG